VEWGTLDYLLIDLPPGTGDAQLTLAQTIPLTGVVIVMTPQDVAMQIASKALAMFRQLKVKVLGIIENMSYFICPHCHESTEIFSRGGGRKASERLGVPFLGEIPLDQELRVGGDLGQPILTRAPESPTAAIYRKLAETLAERVRVETLAAPIIQTR
jgi:ATP-binding protein involved in chromosome partitioning